MTAPALARCLLIGLLALCVGGTGRGTVAVTAVAETDAAADAQTGSTGGEAAAGSPAACHVARRQQAPAGATFAAAAWRASSDRLPPPPDSAAPRTLQALHARIQV